MTGKLVPNIVKGGALWAEQSLNRLYISKILSYRYRSLVNYRGSLIIIIPHDTTMGSFINFWYNVPYCG